MSGEMKDRYADIKSLICAFAAENAAVRAVIAIGSSTREDIPADEYSDLDLFIVTEEPEKWFSGEIPALFGKVSVSFIEPTLGGGRERRVIYDGDRDVDMIILTPVQFTGALEEGEAALLMERGCKLLYDADGFAGKLPRYLKDKTGCPGMSAEEFTNTVNDFFFHNIWARKKLLRGELWAAKMCIDAYLKRLLLKMAEQYRLTMTPGADVWHDGRFFDRWAGEDVLTEVRDCFAHYDREDCERALLATHRLFTRLARTVAEKRGYEYPEEAGKCAREFLESAHSGTLPGQ